MSDKGEASENPGQVPLPSDDAKEIYVPGLGELVGTYVGHQDAVVKIDSFFPPKGEDEIEPFLVTGGCDDTAFLWDLDPSDKIAAELSTKVSSMYTENDSGDEEPSDDEEDDDGIAKIYPRHQLKGKEESIVQVSVHPNGKYIVQADMNGVVYLYGTSDGRLHDTVETEGEEVTYLKFHPKFGFIVGGMTSGNIWIWKLRKKTNKKTGEWRATLKLVRILSGHTDSISDIAFFPSGPRMLSVSHDARAKIWDLAEGETIVDYRPNRSFHPTGINAVAVDPKGSIFVTGDLDGNVNLNMVKREEVIAKFVGINKEKRENEYSKILKELEESSTEKKEEDEEQQEDSMKVSIESLDFASRAGFPWFVSGSLDGTVRIYDLEKYMIRNSVYIDDFNMGDGKMAGVTKVKWIENSEVIIAGSLNGVLYLIDGRSGKIVKEIGNGYGDPILDFKYLDSYNEIVAGHESGMVIRYKMN